MKSYETSTTVEPQGDVRVVGVPFAPGTEVEVTISAKRKGAAEADVSREIAEGETCPPPRQTLADWTKIYEGLTDEQIEEVDKIIKTRANLTRELP
jgi:hypothetical protein